MAVSPRRNFAKPPPVPLFEVATRTRGCSFMNSSATAAVMGKTVEEPSMRTAPLSWSPEPPPPQPASRSPSARATTPAAFAGRSAPEPRDRRARAENEQSFFMKEAAGEAREK